MRSHLHREQGRQDKSTKVKRIQKSKDLKGQKAENSKKGAKGNRKAIKRFMKNDEAISDSTGKAGLILSDKMRFISIY